MWRHTRTDCSIAVSPAAAAPTRAARPVPDEEARERRRLRGTDVTAQGKVAGYFRCGSAEAWQWRVKIEGCEVGHRWATRWCAGSTVLGVALRRSALRGRAAKHIKVLATLTSAIIPRWAALARLREAVGGFRHEAPVGQQQPRRPSCCEEVSAAADGRRRVWAG